MNKNVQLLKIRKLNLTKDPSLSVVENDLFLDFCPSGTNYQCFFLPRAMCHRAIVPSPFAQYISTHCSS